MALDIVGCLLDLDVRMEDIYPLEAVASIPSVSSLLRSNIGKELTRMPLIKWRNHEMNEKARTVLHCEHPAPLMSTLLTGPTRQKRPQ